MPFLCVTSCLVQSAQFSLTQSFVARRKNRTEAEMIAPEREAATVLQQAVWRVRSDYMGANIRGATALCVFSL